MGPGSGTGEADLVTALLIVLILLSDVLAVWFYTRYRSLRGDYNRKLALLLWYIDTRARIELDRRRNDRSA